LVWLGAVSRYILDNGLAKMDFVDRWVNGFAEYRKSLEPFTMEYAEQVCDIPIKTLQTVAEMIAKADGVCVWVLVQT
jgi:formate dehydrogenase major subunit